ncbi:MAG: hypothetical protein HY909_10675 [Deltaproteobacteria bacterium]|nr:hypothetical protein [Deltaproteobacteria bacterium]
MMLLRSIFRRARRATAALAALTVGCQGCHKPEPPAPINMATRHPVATNHGVVGVEGVAAFGTLTPPELERLRAAKVFWGHQSVGRDLMGGTRALGFPFETVTGPGDYARVVRGEAAIADNRDPERKIRSFRELFLNRNIGSAVEVAAFKFCWIDFNSDTDLDALEQHYAQAVDEAHRRFPAVRFFHVTPPLTSDEVRENRIRLAFGQRLRNRYAGQAIVYDLAELQSTHDDGSRCVRDGGAVLCDEYRSDEGHFNDQGAQRAARAFLFAIARSLTP